jgi:hypothetical protein
MMEKIEDDLDMNMSFTNTQNHVPEEEWNN